MKQTGIWRWMGSREGEEEGSKGGKPVLQHIKLFPGMDLEVWAWLASGLVSRREKELGGNRSAFSASVHYRIGEWNELLLPKH